ncbi:MAG: hypothetical protein KY475_22055 [Planctomycetes bacterium]|nr:hypothetical protein [Planctomycetota bacterium]
MRLVVRLFAAFLVLALPAAAPVRGQEAPVGADLAGGAKQADPAESEIAFRFSQDFFRTLFRRNVDRSNPVNQCILGAWVTGTNRTQADVDLVIQPSESEAQIYVVLTGQSVSNTVGVSDPARIYTTTTTTFRAWKLIRFDREGFVASPAGIETDTRSVTRCIGSTARTELVDRVVRRVAADRVAEVRGYTDWLADQQARQRILESFNESVAEVLDEANLRLSVRQTLISRFGGLENLRYRLLTTTRFLEVLVNIASAEEPERPPLADDWSLSPLEIWVRTAIEDETLPPLIQEWAPRYRFFLERGFERLAEAATPEKIDFQLEFTPQLDWVVMRFGDILLERLEQRVEERRKREAEQP